MSQPATPVIQESVPTKPIHTIILDSSPLLLNEPGISTLLANGHVLVTTPSVLAEIRAEEARNRIETLYKPFLTVRSPKSESIKWVKDFARKTGDGAVLSQTDYEVVALAYDIECERNGGDWRLRSTPGQKRVNGSPPTQTAKEGEEQAGSDVETEPVVGENDTAPVEEVVDAAVEAQMESLTINDGTPAEEMPHQKREAQDDAETPSPPSPPATADSGSAPAEPTPELEVTVDGESDDSDEGWITPSNIKKRQAKDESASSKTKGAALKHLQVATMTGDFAIQNVLLQMNLNLLSTKTCKRISQIKQFILRCHACFSTTKDLTKQFCPRCGKPTLTRVTCSTSDTGEVKLHLKANMQWNNRGNVYSIPKPRHGNSNQKWQGPRQGGGQQGWGHDLVLAEDQKEYVRAMATQQRAKERDLMDQDILPSILTGERHSSGARPRVGAGRNINSRKR